MLWAKRTFGHGTSHETTTAIGDWSHRRSLLDPRAMTIRNRLWAERKEVPRVGSAIRSGSSVREEARTNGSCAMNLRRAVRDVHSLGAYPQRPDRTSTTR